VALIPVGIKSLIGIPCHNNLGHDSLPCEVPQAPAAPTPLTDALQVAAAVDGRYGRVFSDTAASAELLSVRAEAGEVGPTAIHLKITY
jgi:hypothetical protein